MILSHLQFVIEVFPDHTHLLFLKVREDHVKTINPRDGVRWLVIRPTLHP